MNIFSLDHALGVCTAVHDINFGYDTDGSNTFWIELSCHLKTVGGCHILVCRQHAEDDSPGIGDIAVGHRSGDLLDVAGLVGASHRDPRDTGQIDEGEVGARVRVDGQHDGLVDDVLARTADLVREEVDGLLDLLEVGELLVRDFLELSPGLNIIWSMIKSEFERPSCNNSISSWQKIKPND